jgi:hypothetical protein
MSLTGVLTRFFLSYIALFVGAVIGLQLLGVASNSGVNVGVLIGAVLWACMAFGSKNGRYFTPSEKARVVWEMIALNLLLQLLVVSAATASPGNKLNWSAVLIGLAMVAVLHSVGIYYFVGLAGKLLEKQRAKKDGVGG